jgi:hemolysin D
MKLVDLAPKRTAAEIDFLPAALEITERPPSPAGRAVMWSIIGMFVLALVWACLGKVDIVAMAPGKIIASGHTKIIQPFETGVVRTIYVQDGQRVKAGDPLIDLDQTITAAEQNRLKAELTAAELDIARLRAGLNSPQNPASNFAPPAGASPSLLAAQHQYMLAQSAERRAKIAAVEQQKVQKEAEEVTAHAVIAKLEAVVPLLRQRAEIHRTLAGEMLVSKLVQLETQAKLVEQEHDLEVQKTHLGEIRAAIAALAEQRNHTAAEFERLLYTELAEAERKAASIREDIVKAEERTRLQHLVSPVDGIVQQLAVHTSGGIVTPAQPLLAVVPSSSALEIEAMISNQDIGFVEEGQEAQIKIDTFNFTRHGLISGRITHISGDAMIRDQAKDSGAPAGDSKGQEAVFSARISLDRKNMQIAGRLANLSPGMTAQAEIKTGQRRIIGYLLSPLLKYQHESIRER